VIPLLILKKRKDKILIYFNKNQSQKSFTVHVSQGEEENSRPTKGQGCFLISGVRS
jgi:hypothetical protein